VTAAPAAPAPDQATSRDAGKPMSGRQRRLMMQAQNASATHAAESIRGGGRNSVSSAHPPKGASSGQGEATKEDLFVDQLKLLPFLLKASQGGVEGQMEVYRHRLVVDGRAGGDASAASAGDADGGAIEITQYPQGVGCAATAGQAAWSWRVWDAAKIMARALESSPELVEGATILELGAGTGLAALAAARLGAKAVVATDLPRALPLLIHNVQANGAEALDPCARSKGGVCCPSGHGLSVSRAKTEDHMCNVCGLADPLGAGIEMGEQVHSCRSCDFDCCSQCHDRAARGEWGQLPGWFKLQCEGEVRSIGAWRVPRVVSSSGVVAAATTTPTPMSNRDTTLMVAPWDLLDEEGANARASTLVEACLSRTGAAPSLVLVADVSCGSHLIQPLVDSLKALQGLLPSPALALVAHEKREAKIDARLRKALQVAGLSVEAMDMAALFGRQRAADDACTMDAKTRERLCMWRIELS
jgi:hypothetical protein